MSLPTGTDVQAVDPVLTNMLVAYYQSEGRFVADRIFPQVPVDKDSGTYYLFTKKYWTLDNVEQRAYGSNFAFGDFGVSTSTYETMQWGLAYSLADEIQANSQVPMSLETAAVRWLGMQHLIRRERAFAADWFVTSVWGTTKSVTNKWSDYVNSDPVADVLEGKRTISQSTGQVPNKFVMGEIVHDRLVNHPDLLDRIKYVGAAGVTNARSALAAIFGVDEILVASAIYNTANEGQTGSYSPIMDDDALLCYVSPAPGVFEASAGYTFTWAPGGGLGVIESPYRDKAKRANIINSSQQFDHVAVATDLGYFFLDVTD